MKRVEWGVMWKIFGKNEAMADVLIPLKFYKNIVSIRNSIIYIVVVFYSIHRRIIPCLYFVVYYSFPSSHLFLFSK